MKNDLDALRKAVQFSQLSEATEKLNASMARDVTSTLRYVREKELILSSRQPEFREGFRNAVISVLTSHDREGTALRLTLPYIAYSDIVAGLRDDIAARANNDAQVLASLTPETYVELCAIAVTALVRQYVARHRRGRAEGSETKPSPSGVPTKLVEAVWEISGTYALLPLMLLEVAAAARSGASRPPLSLLDAARAAQRLCRTAEDWQALSDIRQRVAWHRDNITKVEPDFRVHISPADAAHEYLALAGRRRLALLHSTGLREPTAAFRDFLVPFVEPLVRFVASHTELTRSPADLVNETIVDLASGGMPSDSVLRDIFERSDSTGGLSRSLFSAYLLRYVCAYCTTAFRRGALGYFPYWSTSELLTLLVKSARATIVDAQSALALVAWDPHSTHGAVGLDLSTTPYLKLERERIGMVLLPGVRVAVFTETRRTLAATNSISKAVGTSYERYIRQLFADADFQVAPNPIVLRNAGQPLTDVDALAYKDGVLVICQAKHLVEPDSHHGRWKAQHEITNGVRQCLIARNYFRENPERMFSIFPEMRDHAPLEIFCMVVSPAITFSGDLFWPVAVIDDAYLEHVIHIGETRSFDIHTHTLLGAEPMYDDVTPTGQEFRRLMMFPEYFRYYRGAEASLRSRERAVHHVTFSLLDTTDSLS